MTRDRPPADEHLVGLQVLLFFVLFYASYCTTFSKNSHALSHLQINSRAVNTPSVL